MKKEVGKNENRQETAKDGHPKTQMPHIPEFTLVGYEPDSHADWFVDSPNHAGFNEEILRFFLCS